MEDILGAIETKSKSITKIQSDLERSKLEALEAHKVEQVHVLMMYREGLSRDGGWARGWLVQFSTSRRQQLTTLEPMITGLQESLPKSIGLLPFYGGVADAEQREVDTWHFM
ncbi:uncharacterized protein LOC133818662 isoform X1 [Humulus lupulus]|uniref:uncharacterized protein LOC133818662 isoform X1 n=1 Tax=Humulus lupulus TaxID=3486 RepID=UPI002B40D2FE|nr:uncharacterized protein LOC133818662 isoform X1 [Humulus lupulus]